MIDGEDGAHQAVMSFGDSVRLHSGYLPVIIGGYPLPSWLDPERLHNRDVLHMPAPMAYAERDAVTLACAAREELRDVGITHVMLIGKPEDGAPIVQAFEDWALERLARLDVVAGPVLLEGGGVPRETTPTGEGGPS